jgi:hypothetical protein
MIIDKTGNATWTNRHETFTESIKDLYELSDDQSLDALSGYNDATQGYLNMISEAIANQVPFRALGAGWSWTKIATVNNGIMLDTKSLNTVFDITSDSIDAASNKDPKYLLFAQSGNGIWEIEKHLRQKSQSLKASGASNGQTIAGAIGTGAHGSAFNVGAVQDYVVGLHIIVSANRHVYLERQTDPVVSANFIQNLKTELIQDDDLFNAALVSFGSFGVIQGVMIETEDLFLLETYMTRMKYDDSEEGQILKNVMQTLDFSQANLPHENLLPYHFSVIINPYDLSNGVYVNTMYKGLYRDDYTPEPPNGAGLGPGDDAPAFIGMVTGFIPATIPGLVNLVLSSALDVSKKNSDGSPIPKYGILGEIFNNTTLRGKVLSAAVGFPIQYVNKVIHLMLQLNADIGPFPGLFSFRYMAKTKATLGFTRFDKTCVMELDASYANNIFTFYSKVWLMLENEDIPFTFHWGKVNEINPQRLSNMYGSSTPAWKAARNRLLDSHSIQVFTNPILQQWGLA